MGNSSVVKTKTTDSGQPAGPLRIIIPALVLVVLFVLIVMKGALPLVENRLLSYKKETVRELVRTAMETLVYYHDREERGLLSRSEAQDRAARLF